MSDTFHLVCHETRQQLWVGQAHGGVLGVYSSPDHLTRLGRFLAATKGKPLVLLEAQESDGGSDDWLDYEEFEGATT